MRSNTSVPILGSLLVGAAIAVQGLANGSLSTRLGVGVFAATVSFCLGLVVIAAIAVPQQGARGGITRIYGYVLRRLLPWWIVLGGLGGAAVVVAQSVTVPIIGVTFFTTSVTAGQLVGGLLVDNTKLPPGGKKHITLQRVIGVLIVMAGVVSATTGATTLGFSWWVPLFPFAVGIGMSYQQAVNGRVKVISGSTLTATFVNFVTGSTFLLILSLVLVLTGTRLKALPAGDEWWMFTGGILGVFVIGMSAFVVARLGVLVMTILILLGNMVTSVVVDALSGHAGTALSLPALIALVCVVAGSVVVSTSGRLRAPGRFRQKA